MRHFFSATKLIAETYAQLIDKLPETIHYIYESNCFAEIFITITEVPSEIKQKQQIDRNNFKNKNHNAKNQQFTFTNITKNTNTSLEASPIENMDTIVRS